MISRTIALVMLAILNGSAWAQLRDVRTVPFVDLNKYAGKWYEIARFPNRFQEQCAGNVTAEYGLRPDGRISVVNRCRRADGSYDTAVGEARIADTESNAKLKVRFAPDWLSWIPFVWGDYWIIGLAHDYSYAVVGEPDRKYLWLLSRNPVLPEAAWREAVDVAASQGFDADKLVKTPQER